MFSHARDGLYIVSFEGQCICLDIIDDAYTVFSVEQSRRLLELFEFWDRSTSSPSPLDRNPSVGGRLLLKFEAFDTSDPKLFVSSKAYPGVPIDCWQLDRRQIFTGCRPKLIAHSILALHKVHEVSKAKRLSGLIDLITSERHTKNFNSFAVCEANNLVRSLNAASLLYYKKTKCLEWACALILVGFRFGLDMKLVIGVQNRPFYAHAWVELGGKIIGDDPMRREQLVVIYETVECTGSITK